MSIRVEYVDVPEGAQEDAAFASGDSLYPYPSFNAQELSTGVSDIPYATTEPFSWKLDGSRRLVGPEGVGWWSARPSNEFGEFPGVVADGWNPPLQVVFDNSYTATGITFTFWPSMNHWCSRMTVVWYDYTTEIDRLTVYPTGPEWILQHTVENFNRIEFYPEATNTPYAFAKIQKIQIGQIGVFSQDEITKVNLLNEIDPSLCVLSTDEMSVEIRDKKNRNMRLQKNAEMRLFRDNERIATHYVFACNRKNQQHYTFRCQSAVGRLEDDFLGGICTAHPVNALLTDVLGGFAFSLDAVFDGVTVTGYLPVCSRRDALQQIAFAIGAVVTTQGDGTIRLIPQAESVGGNFDSRDIFSGASIDREADVDSVQVISHTYKRASYNDEVEVLLEDVLVYGTDGFFVFNEPHHSYSVSPGRILESGDNWVKLMATETYPQVTLTGKKYRHTTAVHTAKMTDGGNVLSVNEATLVNDENVTAVLGRLVAYSKLRTVLSQEVVVRGQAAGQIVSSESPFGTNLVGYISSMDSEFTASGHTASVKILGKEE